MQQRILETQVYSVEKLLREARSPASWWHLALVQRELVWSPYKAAKLMESMLHGYPIGSLLLCQAPESHVLKVSGQQRVAASAGSAWQLLDGQQRVWALSALFRGPDPADSKDTTPTFYLKPDAPRPTLKPDKRDPALRTFLTWSERFPGPFDDGGHAHNQRAAWLSLAALGRALLKKPGKAEKLLTGTSAERAQWLEKVEPTYTGPSPTQEPLVDARICALLRAVHTAYIPVQRVELGGPEDVLEVYLRANMEGVRTSQADVFFAAIKTVWTNAEARLDALRGDSGLLSRMDALRLTARFAAVQLDRGDPIPLQIKRLSGDRGKTLAAQMEKVSNDPANQQRIQRTLTQLADRLGYGWWYLDRFLVDDVLGFALARSRALTKRELDDAAGYLFWGTALRLQVVLRTPYARGSFGVLARRKSAGFPLQEAVQAGVKSRMPDLAVGRSKIRRPFDGEAWQQHEVVHSSGRLFLSIAQQIPVSPKRRLDWDHIFPRALRRHLKWRGKKGSKRLQYHKRQWAIWRAGNLVALDFSLNRSLRDAPPKDKLKRLDAEQKAGSLFPAELFLTDADRRQLRAAHRSMHQYDGKTTEALYKMAMQREVRLWEAGLARFPSIGEMKKVLFPDAK